MARAQRCHGSVNCAADGRSGYVPHSGEPAFQKSRDTPSPVPDYAPAPMRVSHAFSCSVSAMPQLKPT